MSTIIIYREPQELQPGDRRAGRDDAPSVVELFACADDVATLENSPTATPHHGALRGLVHELCNLGPEFQVSQYTLSDRFDLRPLVLRTALTYLELGGALRQKTPGSTRATR